MRSRAALLCWAALLCHCYAQDLTPPPGAVLLDLELTVDSTPTRLRLHQDQSYLDAARQACTPTDTPEATDNCVSGAMTIIVNQHLRTAKDGQAAALAAGGVDCAPDRLRHANTKGYSSIYLAMGLVNVRAGTRY